MARDPNSSLNCPETGTAFFLSPNAMPKVSVCIPCNAGQASCIAGTDGK
jgi:hypothetical protein